MKKLLLFFTIVTISLCAMAQKSINDYKYILVPKKFDFQKSEDKYQLNSITKFLFNKYGYEAYFTDEELPEDLNNNPCLALTTEANDEKGNLFKTKVEIILKDCFGEVVKKSKVGESRIKRYERAYNEALREAFKTFQDLDYKICTRN